MTKPWWQVPESHFPVVDMGSLPETASAASLAMEKVEMPADWGLAGDTEGQENLPK